MSLKITEVLSDGARRTIATNGVMFMVLFALYYVVYTVVWHSMEASMGITENQAATHPFIQEIGAVVPAGVLILLAFAVYIGFIWLNLAALRTFVSSTTDYLPKDNFTRNMWYAIPNFFLATILFAIALVFGLIALIIPGLILLVALWFFDAFIAVEDKNFFEALQESWRLTRGNWLSLFLIGVGVIAVSTLITLLFAPVTLLLGGGMLEGGLIVELIQVVPSAIGAVFMVATTAQAFNRLKELQEAEDGPAKPVTADETDDADSTDADRTDAGKTAEETADSESDEDSGPEERERDSGDSTQEQSDEQNQ